MFRRWKGKEKQDLGEPTINSGAAVVGLEDPPGQKYGCRILKENEVDIVFVHGLVGDRIGTWTTESKSRGGRGVCWPLDLLPTSISNARIITFGYDADVVHFWKLASQNRVFDHAKALSGTLGNMREKTQTMDRPIIFIGHSLGGLVIEDCLLNSKISYEEHIQQIFKSTSAIAFLGTPHCGSNKAEWATLSANFLKLATKPNKDILRTLTSGSDTLARIQQDFHRVLNGLPNEKKIKITCFFEELPVKGIGKVVPKHSAILSAYSNYPLHSNHMDMVRFSDINDTGYLQVTDEVGRWVREELGKGKIDTSSPADLARERLVLETSTTNTKG